MGNSCGMASKTARTPSNEVAVDDAGEEGQLHNTTNSHTLHLSTGPVRTSKPRSSSNRTAASQSPQSHVATTAAPSSSVLGPFQAVVHHHQQQVRTSAFAVAQSPSTATVSAPPSIPPRHPSQQAMEDFDPTSWALDFSKQPDDTVSNITNAYSMIALSQLQSPHRGLTSSSSVVDGGPPGPLPATLAATSGATTDHSASSAPSGTSVLSDVFFTPALWDSLSRAERMASSKAMVQKMKEERQDRELATKGWKRNGRSLGSSVHSSEGSAVSFKDN